MAQMFARGLRHSAARQLWQLISQRTATRRTVLIKLIEDVDHVGKKDEIVYVKPGHMRHTLYPSKKANYALSTDKPTVKAKKERIIIKPTNEQLVLGQLDEVVRRLTSRTVEINLPFKERWKKEPTTLITAEVISRLIKQKMHIDLSPTLLELKSPILESGHYKIPLNFIHDNKRDLNIQLAVTQISEKA